MGRLRPPAPCADCGITTVGNGVWRNMTTAERAGKRRHDSNGRCSACAQRHRYGAPVNPEAATRMPLQAVLEEWEWMSHDWSLSRWGRVTRAADRLGMTPAGLDKALRRAGVAA